MAKQRKTNTNTAKIKYVLGTRQKETIWHVQLSDGTKKWIYKKNINKLLTPYTKYIISDYGSKRRNGKNEPIMIPVFWKGFAEPSIMRYDDFKEMYEVYRKERGL